MFYRYFLSNIYLSFYTNLDLYLSSGRHLPDLSTLTNVNWHFCPMSHVTNHTLRQFAEMREGGRPGLSHISLSSSPFIPASQPQFRLSPVSHVISYAQLCNQR
jgi:hypothetical protein